ncbi:MAG: hypothetical protein ACFFAN_06260 [Promethearchaeota archaeon]
MSKFEKKTAKKKRSKSKKISEEKLAFRTVKISAILGGFFLALSTVFNGTEWFIDGIILNYMEKEIYWEILDVSIKVGVILLAFLFMMISIGNYKELTGKPVKLKEILLLVGFSLVQTIRDLYVFIFTLIGLALMLLYLYLVQEEEI